MPKFRRVSLPDLHVFPSTSGSPPTGRLGVGLASAWVQVVLWVHIGPRKRCSGHELVIVPAPSQATGQCSLNTYYGPRPGGIKSTGKAQPLLSGWTHFSNLPQMKDGFFLIFFFSLETYNMPAKGKKLSWGRGRK